MRNRMLGLFGLWLIVLVGWASDQTSRESHRLATRASRVFGWLVIESVTAIGWAFDRLAPVEVTATTTRLADRRHLV
jgi:hypothetical protein